MRIKVKGLGWVDLIDQAHGGAQLLVELPDGELRWVSWNRVQAQA